ncbi:MAG: hypothetical protein KME05_11565 [Gloeocapsa sp. UFS-A4-WI-NPMV-4B04]|jgi:hypothetical protein|nr:hypothetical protein [Gloeocapsa sp. UFS-A4-WI-NPMV-4B04]
MSNQQRMDALASQFGDKDKISIFLSREKIYPGKEVSDTTVERLENALRSPESEKGTLRVLEETRVSKKAELIYRSSQNALDFDPKNIAQQFQANTLSQAPEIPQVEQSQENEIISDNTIGVGLESPAEEYDGRGQDFPIVEEPTARDEPGGAIVLARQSKEIIPFPVNPTQPELDEKIQEILNANEPINPRPMEEALASANARIDSLQAQLEDTKKSLNDLSKFVRNDNLKSWAGHKVTEITKTSQFIAEQAKNKVMQWVQAKTSQVKEAVHEKVNEVKVVAQNKVAEVKTATQVMVTEVKTVAQDKVNEVKVVAQNKVAEVKTAAQLKGIGFKESVREQANKFLAPVNSAEVERAAKYVVSAYGDGKSYNKAATHSFQLNDKNELSIARQADGAVVYQKGEITKAASSHDILKLNALPAIVNQIKVTQMHEAQKQEMEVGG